MEEKTNKLGVFKTAQIKRMAVGMKPIIAKIDRLTVKIDELFAQRATFYSQINEIQNCIRAYVGDEDQMLEASGIVEEVLEGKKEGPKSEEEETSTQIESAMVEEVEETPTQDSSIEKEEALGAEFEPGIQEETGNWATK